MMYQNTTQGIVDELRAAHSAFWDNISPALQDACPHVLGNEAENPTRLDAMDIMGDIAWDQPHILEALKTQGHWTVEIERPGLYRFGLRRWPKELELPISAVPEAENLSVNNRHGASGRHLSVCAVAAQLCIAGQVLNKTVAAEDAEVVFELELNSFVGSLQAIFSDDVGEERSVYYVYVERRPAVAYTN